MRWRTLARTVAATALVTSAFWVILGGWLYYRYLHEPRAPAAPASAAAVADDRTLAIPVSGVAASQLTDTFAQARANGRRHDAIDILAPEGAPVIAAAPGRVEKLFVSNDGGNTVYVRSPDGRTQYYYAHLSAYAPGLAEGKTLRRRDPVGAVGHTGDANAAAPHLHFAIALTAPERKWYEDGQAIDPYPLLVRK